MKQITLYLIIILVSHLSFKSRQVPAELKYKIACSAVLLVLLIQMLLFLHLLMLLLLQLLIVLLLQLLHLEVLAEKI